VIETTIVLLAGVTFVGCNDHTTEGDRPVGTISRALSSTCAHELT
jgi:hypothetical protein